MKTAKIRITFWSVILLLCMIEIAGCEKKTNDWGEDYYIEGNQKVSVSIAYDRDFTFLKEAMDIYIDNHKFSAVNSGDTNITTYNLTKGMHVLKVASSAAHYDTKKFEVKNTGDSFWFSIQNGMHEVKLSLLESGIK